VLYRVIEAGRRAGFPALAAARGRRGPGPARADRGAGAAPASAPRTRSPRHGDVPGRSGGRRIARPRRSRGTCGRVISASAGLHSRRRARGYVFDGRLLLGSSSLPPGTSLATGRGWTDGGRPGRRRLLALASWRVCPCFSVSSATLAPWSHRACGPARTSAARRLTPTAECPGLASRVDALHDNCGSRNGDGHSRSAGNDRHAWWAVKDSDLTDHTPERPQVLCSPAGAPDAERS
jgi:hypothetical protein